MRQVLFRLWANPLGRSGVVILTVLVIAAVAADLISTADPLKQNLSLSNRPPGWASAEGSGLMGTDMHGRDNFVRILHGLRSSLLFGVVTATGAALVGLCLGIIGGYYSRYIGPALMRWVDIQFSVPFIAVGVALAAVVGEGLLVLSVVFMLWGWTGFCRTVYSSVLQLKKADYVTAVRVQGASHIRIMVRHILPNLIGPMVVLWSSMSGVLILVESALSLLGLGAQAPDFSLGTILMDGKASMRYAWWTPLFSGLFIGLAVISFQLIGDALRDALNRSESRKLHNPVLV